MRIDIKSYSKKSSLVSSILFFILGAILTAYSERIMSTAYRIIGAGFLVITIGIIVSLIIKKKRQEPIFLNRVALAIITLILSILFFFFHTVIDETIRFVIGAWILFSGVTRLISALRTNNKASKFFAILIVSLIQIGLGFFTIIKNGIVLWVVGIILMLYAIIEIIGYVFYSKDNENYDEDEEGDTKLLIPDKDDDQEKKKEKKVKKIKDVEENDIEEK
ncbi:MAG: DUF308 domain-containing protein [Bacilli bacterium]|nr:DUF308 domain-containing protein [Bacilli bacterium]